MIREKRAADLAEMHHTTIINLRERGLLPGATSEPVPGGVHRRH